MDFPEKIKNHSGKGRLEFIVKATLKLYPAEFDSGPDMKPTLNRSDGTLMSAAFKRPSRLELDHLSDVEIVCGHVKFKCHKFALSRSSKVFMAMFQHPLVESKSNQVSITDFHPDTVESMVNFIYNGVPDEDTEYDEELLAIADKYEIIKLKKLCESALAKTLNNSNVAETWVFANKFNASYLKEEIIKYFGDNWSKKDELENLDTVLEENPSLIKDLLYRLT